MVELDQFVKRTRTLDKHLEKKGADLLMKHRSEIVRLSKEQLLQGLNTNAKLMQRGYSPQYAKKRKKAGLQTGFVDLKFTGKYQDTKKAVKAQKGINIISDADYEKYLRGNFPDHVGLTQENSEIVVGLISEDLAVVIKQYLTT